MGKRMTGNKYQSSAVMSQIANSSEPVHLIDASDPNNLQHLDGNLRYSTVRNRTGYTLQTSQGNPRPVFRSDLEDAQQVNVGGTSTWVLKIDSSQRREKRRGR